MKTSIKIFICIILAAAISGCSKDDNLFDGKDTTISSFQLKLGEVILKASVLHDSIVITAPENLSLSGAVPTVVLSENASIKPDPSTISDWDKPHEFVITSYNGTQISYTYNVERNVISKDGDVVLITQDDVNTLAALGLSRINGSLTIGKDSGQDSIRSLAALSGLKTIVYDLVINPTYAGKDLGGLENLETAGSVQIGQVKNLQTISFPKLKKIMLNLIINGAGVKVLSFPELSVIDWGMQLLALDALESMDFPKLKSVLQNITVQGSYNTNVLEAIEFPVLESLGGNLTLSQWSRLTAVKLPLLARAVSLSITGFSKLEAIAFPKLQILTGDADLSYNAELTELDLSALKTVRGNFRLQSAVALGSLTGLKQLTSVGGELFLYSLTAIKDLNGLRSLQSVGGNVMLSGFDKLEDGNMEGLAALRSIGGALTISQVPFKKFSGFGLSEINTLSIFGYVSTIEEIDLSRLNISNGITISNISTPVKLKGKEAYDCSLTIESTTVELEGFKEVKDFSYNMTSALKPVQTVAIRKIKNNFNVSIYSFSKFSMPNLEEVGGTSSVNVSSKMELDFPALKRTGALSVTATMMDILKLPALQLVDGDCIITTGNYQGSMADIQLPALTRISGQLKLSGYSSSYMNTKITNLNGFSALTNVKGVTITYNRELADFSGLKNALASFTAADWSVANNKYNPTYQDMVSGKYVK